MVDSKKDGKSLRISDKLTLRYEKFGKGPPLVLLHTIRTQLEYFDEPQSYPSYRDIAQN